jgi:hypothetical protein
MSGQPEIGIELKIVSPRAFAFVLSAPAASTRCRYSSPALCAPGAPVRCPNLSLEIQEPKSQSPFLFLERCDLWGTHRLAHGLRFNIAISPRLFEGLKLFGDALMFPG